MAQCEHCGRSDEDDGVNVTWAALHDCWMCGECQAQGINPWEHKDADA